MLQPFIRADRLGRTYEFEIAYVGFLHGFVVWWDDEPWDDHVFVSHKAAFSAIERELK